MFCETTRHKWDIVTIHSRLLHTISRMLNTHYRFFGFHVTTNNITSFFAPLSVKGFLIYRCLEKFYTAISFVINLSIRFVDWKCFEDGWCLMDDFRLNYFIRFRQVLSNNRCTNFMTASENSLGLWTTIWLDFTFWKMTFLMVPLMSSIETLPWCPSL